MSDATKASPLSKVVAFILRCSLVGCLAAWAGCGGDTDAVRPATATTSREASKPAIDLTAGFAGALILLVGPDGGHTDVYRLVSGRAPARITTCQCAHKVSAYGSHVVVTAGLMGPDEARRIDTVQRTGLSSRVISTGRGAAVGPAGEVSILGEVKHGGDYVDGVVATSSDGTVEWRVATPHRQVWNMAWAGGGRVYAVLGRKGRGTLVAISHGRVTRRSRVPLRTGGIVMVNRHGRVAVSSAGETAFWSDRGWQRVIRHPRWAVQSWTADGSNLLAVERGAFARVAILSPRTGRVTRVIAELHDGLRINGATMASR
jgi:hypothetical protein